MTNNNNIESESQLEDNLIQRLADLGYARVTIKNNDELLANLKKQLETHNKLSLTNIEFKNILNHLDKGNVFDKAKTLRDRYQLNRDDGTSCYIQFFNTTHWCQNEYQVTNQVTVEGKYQNRYDVTLLINGLPLVQIELKRRGMELKEAFNQVARYQRHSYWAESGLFNYIQLFVISNGVNTKYYSNNRKTEYKQTFYWTDKDNNLITQLNDFSDQFLEKCHVSKMISKYIVLHESDKLLMVLRPYQYYAVEAIEARVKESRKHGYIWHTTGSGKTLTSFKAAQIMTELPKIHKVVFVVDRADLDYQTTREFNFFSAGSVDGTNNTHALVKQMADDDTNLIVTTIQKLNTAIKKTKHEKAMEALRNKRIVFIFDECHRSQFGETHKNIVAFFTRAQMFGFTGTPIFADNATSNEHGKRTTKDLFEECLHRYLINHAIADENVLKFAVEYWHKIKRKDGEAVNVSADDMESKEFFEDQKRIDTNIDHIIKEHPRKTHDKQFSAILCVSSSDMLIKYYDSFKRKKEAGKHDLRVVTIFSFEANADDQDANGLIGDPDFDIKTDDPKTQHKRDILAGYVEDYNAMYQTQHSVKDGTAFYTYYKDIAKRMKERDREDFQDKERADILLVVNMFLTGFDAKKLNTLYVDKSLRYHGLIQAFSRTNRILGELKSQGNIVCFRNLKEKTDEAIKLFCDKDASETVLMESYGHYVGKFNIAVTKLLAIAETPDAVNQLAIEDDKLKFVKAFRTLMRLLNQLTPFTEFTWDDLHLSRQTFEDFKSKYLDIYDSFHDDGGGDKPPSPELEGIDFELELVHRDEINVAYILKLLGDIQEQTQKSGATADTKKAMDAVLDMLGKEAQLRDKRELIETFMTDYMPHLSEKQDLGEIFAGYWAQEKRREIHAFCVEEHLDKGAVYQMMADYHFSGKDPQRTTVFEALDFKPKLAQRKKLYERILKTFKSIIQRYEDDTGALSLGTVVDTDLQLPITDIVHHVKDSELFFTDEVQVNASVTELVQFDIEIGTDYTTDLGSLDAFPLAGNLLGHGVINATVLFDYISLTAECQQILAEHGLAFAESDSFVDGSLFWSFTEARAGSTVLEFSLNTWGYNEAIGGPAVGLLEACTRAAEGFEKLQAHINAKFSADDESASSSMRLAGDLHAEMVKMQKS